MLVGRIGGQAVFKGPFAVLEHIFGDFAQVDVEVTPGGQSGGVVHKRIHQPEFHVFHVVGLKIGITRFDLAHDAAPAFIGVVQVPVGTHAVAVEVIGSAFPGVIGQVHHGQRSNLVGEGLISVGENFPLVDHPHKVVGELFLVIADVTWRLRTASVVEETVDAVPGQQGSVMAVTQVVVVGGFGKQAACRIVGGAGQEP
ncbi:MAG: hypothetical protein BWY72_01268 [Bacteroidetes bacterium ADurb.Bin416]|nr:MAG: hypothetical protein BWY72_01268 [Bacteroidetes bacterium ADurb.Bin416]